MSLAPDPQLDDVLVRFLKAHRLLHRVTAGTPFVAPVGAPAAARRRREATNVIRLGGYYRLAIRRCEGGALEVGLLHGRRPDLRDATFLGEGARVLSDAAALRAACDDLVDRVEPPPRWRRHPVFAPPSDVHGRRLRLRRSTLTGD